jgi:hypothetical protein
MARMKKAYYSVLIVGFGSLLGMGCGSDAGNGGSGLVDPTDPNALSQVIVIPGAQRVEGQPPEGSGTPDAPTISGGGDLETDSGDQTVIEVGYESPSGYVDCYVQVIGADDYFLISAPSSETTGLIQIPVNIPANVSSGAFDFYTCIAGDNGGVSNALRTSVDVTYTGTSGGGGGDVICASDDPSVGSIIPCPNGSSLDFCVDQGTGSCYYSVGGNAIQCGNCLTGSADIASCAQSAVEMCF